MKKITHNSILLAVAASALAHFPLAMAQATTPAPAQAAAAENASPFKSRKEAISYAIGVTTARNLAKDGVEIDSAIVIQGMQDAQSGKRVLLTEKEIRSVMSGLVGEMRQKLASNRKDAEEMNKKRGDEYRATFSKQTDVKTLPNGVLYKVLKAGAGPRPTEEDMVLVNYRGTLPSGFEFDGSPDGKPVLMRVAQLIVGWKEAIKQMPVGSKWAVVIPPQLAYGVRGVGADIGPNETLVFDIELVAIQK
jgi:FKBP-type peptidyl-prolyl cis-trans isomerase